MRSQIPEIANMNIDKKNVKKNNIIILFFFIIFLIISFNIKAYTQPQSHSRTDSVYLPKIDSLKFYIINKIEITGNETSKEKVILKELTFKETDTLQGHILKLVIEESRINLLKTPLFNYVTITCKSISDNKVNILIKVEERWYIWPFFRIVRAEQNFSAWLQDMDFSKLNYSIGFQKYNFRGLNEKITFNYTTGFNKVFSLHYNGLYIDKERKHSLSASVYYKRQNQLAYTTINNESVYVKNESNHIIEETNFLISYLYRPNLNTKHVFLYKWTKSWVNDTVIKLNSNYLGNNNQMLQYNLLQYQYILDYRNSSYYPLKGFYSVFKINKFGLGFKNENVNLLSFYFDFRKYLALKKRFYLASSIFIKKATQKYEPFYFYSGLGYKNDFLRGYEYYVINGQDYGYIKTQLKFELLPKKIIHFKFIPLPKFNKIHFSSYLNIFADAGYVSDKTNLYITNNNTLSNSLLISYGIGIDFVSYYDKVIRIEYSINKLKEGGIFFHFMAPI